MRTRPRNEPLRQAVLSFKVTPAARELLVKMRAHFETTRGEKWSLTDVVEEALNRLAESVGVKK